MDNPLFRDVRSAQGTHVAVLPPLSTPFITADDAARWAQQHVGKSVGDKEFGGAIFKKDNHFFATRPVEGGEVTFDHREIMAVDERDHFIAPAGYTCAALYHSHPAHADKIKQHNPTFNDDQAAVFTSFFSPADMVFIIEHRQSVPAHYLCGPTGTLLKYTTSGSALEKTLLQGLKGQVPLAASADFESFIWQVAEGGDLRVVVADALWGQVRGRVKRGWRIKSPVGPLETVQEQPFFTRVFKRPELAVLAALESTPATVTGRTVGFVLKHVQKDTYVATRPQAPGPVLFSPASLFPKRPDGKPRLPSQFRLEAIYYRSWPQPSDFPSKEPWMYSAFFTPAQLVAGITQARNTADIQADTRGLALYMEASDGAVLKLQLPGAVEAEELVDEGPGGVFNDKGAQAEMIAGTLTPRGFVRRVINTCSLSVVRPGELWRRVGEVDNRSSLLTPFYQAVLSPTFLSATDAAVYAHEKVGGRRDRSYGGYILKSEDGRFIITEPMESQVNPFASALFFPAGDQGPLVPPEPYVIHGRYGSHVALSMVHPDWIEQRRWTREEAEINLQVFSAEELHGVIQQGRPAYLSASETCLLAYTPSGSANETVLLNGVVPEPGGSRAQQRLDKGLIKPAQWVGRVAETGGLQVIQGNALWGPRSPVYSDWTPNFTYADRAGPPDFITYGAIFSTAEEAARDLHARVHGHNRATESCYAFILKHTQNEQYIATQVMDVTTSIKLFSRNALFARTDKGYVFPPGFMLRALFRSQQWQPTGLTTSKAWLTRFFVLPTVLYSSLYDAKRFGELYNAGDNLPIYFSTEEGALLRYRLPGPFAFGSGGALEKELEATQTALASGAKTPLDFVREWAKRGQLHVVRTSQCWDERGAVNEHWQGYATLMRRRLSPAFAEPDDAVRHVRTLIGDNRQRAYGGVVLRLGNGLFVATAPLAIPPQGFVLNWIFPDQAVSKGLYPEGATVVGRYRSTLAREVPILLSATEKAIYTSMVPTSVLSNLLRREVHVKREYLIGSDGVLLSYNLTDSPEEQTLKADLAALDLVKGDVGDNLIERRIRSGELLPTQFVSRVAKAGELRVVEGSRYWGPPRRLLGEFSAFVYQWPGLLIRGSLADPAFSPVFTQADDAVSSVLPPSDAREWLTFGYLLKSTRKEHYRVTLPLQRQDFSRLEQVFPYAQLPQGYAIVGLYLCASSAAIGKAGDPMGRSFFWPRDIADGLSFVKKTADEGYWPLYLRCADDALLKFQFDGLDRSVMFSSETTKLHSYLRGGALQLVDYVHSLAVKGTLDVVETSPVWNGRGRIDTSWQPGAAAVYVYGFPAPLLVCGPVCAHPDDAARHAQGLSAGFAGKTLLGGVLKVAGTNDVCAVTPIEEDQSTALTVPALFASGGGLALASAHPAGYYQVVAVQSFYKAMAVSAGAEVFESTLRANFIAEADLKAMLDALRMNEPSAEGCYFISRGGALLKYLPTNPVTEHTLAATGPQRSATQLIGTLRANGKLSVLETDAFWTRLGELGDEWQIKDVGAQPEPEDVQYGRDRDEL